MLAVPRAISILHWLHFAIIQEVSCQVMVSREPFSIYFQPKTVMVALLFIPSPSLKKMGEVERNMISE
jgi:hypothetical protein